MWRPHHHPHTKPNTRALIEIRGPVEICGSVEIRGSVETRGTGARR